MVKNGILLVISSLCLANFSFSQNKSDSSSCHPDVRIVQVFSPNADGLNDCFDIRFLKKVEKYKLLVYNRWGQLVFETKKVEDCWNGRSNNKDCPDGTYFWTLNFTFENTDEEISCNGYVTLIR